MDDNLTIEQLHAFNSFLLFLNSDDKIFLLSGSAGVGKTFLTIKFIQVALNYFNSNEIIVLCPTHKSLNVIEKKYDVLPPITFQTIAKFFTKVVAYDDKGVRYFKNKQNQKSVHKLIFVDEASMIIDDDFNQLLSLNKVKLVFIGDYAQLEPIQETGSSKVFDDKYLQEKEISIEKVELKQIVRSKNNELCEIYDSFRSFVDNKDSHEIQFKMEWYDPGIYQHFLFVDTKFKFLELIKKYFTTDYECKIIAYRNVKVVEYNQFARNLLFNNPAELYVEGEHLIFNEPYESFNNNDEIEIVNVTKTSKRHPNGFVYQVYDMETRCGEKVIALQKESKKEYMKYFQNLKKQVASCKTKSWKKYYDNFYLFNPPFAYSYAITTHKAQGSTIDVCFVDLYDIFYTLVNIKPDSIEKTLYTAVSRAALNLYCYF